MESSDFTLRIERYLTSGSVLDFLNHLHKDGDDRVKAANGNRQSEVVIKPLERAIVTALHNKPTDYVALSSILGCLTAVKALHFKSQCKVDVANYLHASRTIVNRTTHFSSITAKVAITDAYCCLLNTSLSLAHMEAICMQNITTLTTALTDPPTASIAHMHVAPMPFTIASMTKQSKKQQRKQQAAAPPITFPEASEDSSLTSFRATTSTTFQALELFPILLTVDVHHEVLTRYLTDLMANDSAALAMRFAKIYPDKVNLTTFQTLMLMINQNEGWATVGDILLLFLEIRKLAAKHVPTTFPSSPVSFTAARNILYGIQQRQLARNSADSTAHLAGTIMAMPSVEYQEMIVTFINDCCTAKTTLSLRAALKVALQLNNNQAMAKEVKRLATHLKMSTLVAKGKWTIATEQHTKTEDQVMLFQILCEAGLYREAQSIYPRIATLVSAVDPVLVDIQDAREKEQYLAFPMDRIPVTMVDSQVTVERLEARLCATLAATSSSSSAAAVQSSKGKKKYLSFDEVYHSYCSTGNEEKESRGHKKRQKLRKMSPILPVPPPLTTAATTISTESAAAVAEDAMTTTANMDIDETADHAFTTTTTAARSNTFREIVGIDLEWYSDFKRYIQADMASIMQIAFADEVFIIDFVKLSHYGNGSNFREVDKLLAQTAGLLRALFADPSILKVSFSFDGSDEGMLRDVRGGAFKEVTNEACSIFDLKRALDKSNQQTSSPILRRILSRHITSTTASSSSDGGISQLNSLSDVTQHYLGRPLLKSERLSNWNERPLRPKQLEYAALDAHALLGVYDVLLRQAGVDSGLKLPSDMYGVDT